MKISDIKRRAREVISNNFSKVLIGSLVIMLVQLFINLVCPIPIEILEATEFNTYIIKIFLKYSIITFLFNMLFLPVTIGTLYYLMNIVNNRDYTIKDIFKFLPNAIMIWGVFIVNNLLISLGSSLFIIPGIYFSLKLVWVYYLIADGETGILNIIKKSFFLSKGYIANYLLFNLSFIWWHILSALSSGIANIYVIPYIYISHIIYFNELKKEKKTAQSL